MLQTENAAVTAEAGGEAPAALERMVLFGAGGHLFAVPIGDIREVIPARPYTPLPGAAGHVCGLINLRGRIVTVVDLGARLGLAPSRDRADHSVVIVEHRGRLAGLAVEDVARIAEVDPGTLGTAADLLRSIQADRAFVRGVGEVDGRIFVAVDPDALFGPILA